MKTVAYLIVTSLKNWLLNLVRRPALLVVLGFMAAIFIGGLVLTLTTPLPAAPGNLVWGKAYLLGLLLMVSVTGVVGNLKGTSRFFALSDVALLFPSPVDPRPVLVYGIGRQLGPGAITSMFLVVAAPTLGSTFGIDTWGVVILAVAIVLAAGLVGALPAMALLVFTAGQPGRRRPVGVVAVALILPLVAVGAYHLVTGATVAAGARAWIDSPVTDWTPLVGWATAAAVACATGEWARAGLFAAPLLAVAAGLVVYLAKARPDFYEEALVGPETQYQRLRAIAEGQVSDAALNAKPAKVAAVGLRGHGAAAIFHKHLREAFRAHRLGPWGPGSILLVALAVVYALAWRFTAHGEGLVYLLAGLMLSQTLTIGSGSLGQELYLPHIYLIPQPPMAKLAATALVATLKATLTGGLSLLLGGIVLGSPPGLIVAACGAVASFALLLAAVSYVSLRWAGADIGPILQLYLGLASIGAVLAPGLIAAVLLATQFTLAVAVAALAAWQAAATVGCFAIAQGLLHHCDMPVIKLPGQAAG